LLLDLLERDFDFGLEVGLAWHFESVVLRSGIAYLGAYLKKALKIGAALVREYIAAPAKKQNVRLL